MGVAQQFLYGPDVVAVFKEVRGKTVAQYVRRRVLGDPRLLSSSPDRLLNHRLMQVVERRSNKALL